MTTLIVGQIKHFLSLARSVKMAPVSRAGNRTYFLLSNFELSAFEPQTAAW